jgi:hypothetical protein
MTRTEIRKIPFRQSFSSTFGESQIYCLKGPSQLNSIIHPRSQHEHPPEPRGDDADMLMGPKEKARQVRSSQNPHFTYFPSQKRTRRFQGSCACRDRLGVNPRGRRSLQPQLNPRNHSTVRLVRNATPLFKRKCETV